MHGSGPSFQRAGTLRNTPMGRGRKVKDDVDEVTVQLASLVTPRGFLGRRLRRFEYVVPFRFVSFARTRLWRTVPCVSSWFSCRMFRCCIGQRSRSPQIGLAPSSRDHGAGGRRNVGVLTVFRCVDPTLSGQLNSSSARRLLRQALISCHTSSANDGVAGHGTRQDRSAARRIESQKMNVILQTSVCQQLLFRGADLGPTAPWVLR
ncbi:hypothetical protein GA0061093_11758 [Rhodococcus qingshengii]|nr:hypothetical protein GA0061093_11758 [Rhodococcus qingshengii]